MKLCAPAVVYLVLAAIGLVFQFTNYASSKNPILTIVVHLLFIGLWTAILNWICSKGFKSISWALVIIPYAFMFLTVFVAAEYMALRQAGF
jgi:hypothetical protein